ncbi:MAG: hypothetical protein AAGB04_00215 [Pseudomonadota bacterium]
MTFVSSISGQWIEEGQPGYDGGVVPRDRAESPLCCGAGSGRVELPLIPENEWLECIEQMEAAEARSVDLREQTGLKSLNQGRTNSCWAQCVVQNFHYRQRQLGYTSTPLSSGSVVGPVKKWRNVGGMVSQAIEHIHDDGIVPASMFPANAVGRDSRRYYTDEAVIAAQDYKALDWWDVEPNNGPELATCLLSGFQVGICYLWMRHAVLAIDLVSTPKGLAVLCDNSGYGRDRNGLTVIPIRKAFDFDDAVAIRSITAMGAAA